MSENNKPAAHPHASAMGRAAIGLAGVGASVGGALGSFAELRLLSQNIFTTVEGTRSFLTPLAIYHAVWLVFFLALLVVGVSMIVSTIRGRSSDIIPGPSLYVMGTSLVVAGMFQMVFGNIEMAAITGLIGVVLMVVEYRSALI